LILYIKNRDIDRAKWDVCIQESPNPLVYAMSWYLDIVCPGWAALVEDDYKLVFPLTWGNKFGISYLYQPMFTQQLGFFSVKSLIPEKVNQIIQSLPDRYLLADINLWNDIELKLSGAKVYERNNYQLNLDQEYSKIQDGYTSNTQRNIARARNDNLIIQELESDEPILKLKKENLKVGLKEKHFQKLKNLISYAREHNYGKVYGVLDSNSKLLASAFFIFYKNRLIYLLSASSKKGKETRAMFFLVDEIIRMNSGTNKLLDFEGSEIAGLARFFSGFGAENVTYKHLSYNNLPFPLKPIYKMLRS